MRNEWKEFKGGRWETEIDVRDFIMNNYTPYDGDDSFLKGPTADTTALWNEVLEPLQEGTRGRRRTGHGYQGRFHHPQPWPRLPG